MLTIMSYVLPHSLNTCIDTRARRHTHTSTYTYTHTRPPSWRLQTVTGTTMQLQLGANISMAVTAASLGWAAATPFTAASCAGFVVAPASVPTPAAAAVDPTLTMG